MIAFIIHWLDGKKLSGSALTKSIIWPIWSQLAWPPCDEFHAKSIEFLVFKLVRTSRRWQAVTGHQPRLAEHSWRRCRLSSGQLAEAHRDIFGRTALHQQLELTRTTARKHKSDKEGNRQVAPFDEHTPLLTMSSCIESTMRHCPKLSFETLTLLSNPNPNLKLKTLNLVWNLILNPSA